jgi:hypothetical protein
MNLVKIGSRYINLDNVYQVIFREHPTAKVQATLDVTCPVSIYPDGPEEVTGPIEAVGLTVFGEEAEALRHYLDGTAQDAGKYYQDHLTGEREQAGEE